MGLDVQIVSVVDWHGSKVTVSFSCHSSAGDTESIGPLNLLDNNNPELSSKKEETIWDLSTFDVFTNAPETHKFKYLEPKDSPTPEWLSLMSTEIRKLKDTLPEGVWMRGYENRMVRKHGLL